MTAQQAEEAEAVLAALGGRESLPVNSVDDEHLRQLDSVLRQGFSARAGANLKADRPTLIYENPKMKQVTLDVWLVGRRKAGAVDIHPRWQSCVDKLARTIDLVVPPQFAERPFSPAEVDAYLQEAASQTSEACQRFATIVVESLRQERATSSPTEFGGPRIERSDYFREAAVMFAIGHEYAHIFYGHFDDDAPDDLDTMRIPHFKSSNRGQQEPQADVASLLAGSWALSQLGQPPALIGVGALVLFALQAGSEAARPEMARKELIRTPTTDGSYLDVTGRMENSAAVLEEYQAGNVVLSVWEAFAPVMRRFRSAAEAAAEMANP